MRVVSCRRAATVPHKEGDNVRKQYDFSQAVRGAVLAVPAGTTRITIHLDDDVIAWFHEQVDDAGGGNYHTLINQVLRQFVEESTRKWKRLKAAGWRAGTVAEFLELSDVELALVEMHLSLSKLRRAAVTSRRFKSLTFKAIHSSASALLKAGAISKKTMREFDKACLPTRKYVRSARSSG